ncbi:T9SS type B sorting domain-containing protein [Pedobacter frigiditerrae]|uniref:T9SS type B sorting domain-containing protein n=1 Tax=Pedobacter frigiditerrae TaxID=2530452 RepID=A0A4R0N3B2_9SPHI|nr:gliding motility-associated C-terminal domain-containing protein [Pedobacter frigiditerrae]TCC94348.1 T9SS type B sorting domain-containing protein [Pedobacter frigiditerrae]
MLNKTIGFLLSMLLLFAMVSFAQSPVPQTVNIASGKTVTLKANSTGGIKYQWLKDAIPITGEIAQSYTTGNAGTYTVISYNIAGCISDVSDPVIITVDDPLKTADLMITKTSEARAISVNEVFEYNLRVKNNGPSDATGIKVTDALPKELTFSQLINPSIGVASYSESTRTIIWDIPKVITGETADLKIKVMASKPGLVKNIAMAYALENDPKVANNTSIDFKPIIGVLIPNVFTPNNDGKNDFFKITGLEYYTSNELTIINRWQSTVYEKKGYQNDWTANGLSDGTYFYVLRVKTANSAWQELTGYITVVR